MSNIPDKDLIQNAKTGDKEAFKELFNRYNETILNYIYRYTGDFQKAEDITINTFWAVWRRLGSYKEEGNFLSWLYRIAINFARKEFRKKKSLHELFLDTPVSDDKTVTMGDLEPDNKMRPDSEAAGHELAKLLEKAIAELDEKYRTPLLLCEVEGMSYEKAALMLSCNKITVGTRIVRAKKILCDLLKKQGYMFRRYSNG